MGLGGVREHWNLYYEGRRIHPHGFGGVGGGDQRQQIGDDLDAVFVANAPLFAVHLCAQLYPRRPKQVDFETARLKPLGVFETERVELLAVTGPGSVVDAELAGLAVAAEGGDPVFVPLAERGGAQDGLPMGDPPPRVSPADALAALEAFLQRGSGGRPWAGVETKRLQAVLGERGLALPQPDFDTQLAAFLVEPSGAHDIPSLALQSLGTRVQSYEELAGRGAKAVPVTEIEPDALGRLGADESLLRLERKARVLAHGEFRSASGEAAPE